MRIIAVKFTSSQKHEWWLCQSVFFRHNPSQKESQLKFIYFMTNHHNESHHSHDPLARGALPTARMVWLSRKVGQSNINVTDRSQWNSPTIHQHLENFNSWVIMGSQEFGCSPTFDLISNSFEQVIKITDSLQILMYTVDISVCSSSTTCVNLNLISPIKTPGQLFTVRCEVNVILRMSPGIPFDVSPGFDPCFLLIPHILVVNRCQQPYFCRLDPRCPAVAGYIISSTDSTGWITSSSLFIFEMKNSGISIRKVIFKLYLGFVHDVSSGKHTYMAIWKKSPSLPSGNLT